jgi:GT2 family glycosyltransferase
MTAPALSILIPSFDGEKRLPRTLEALAAQRLPGGFEVIVTDDGSADGTAEAARRLAGPAPMEVLRHPENRGRAAAVNTALRRARAPIVLVLDDDMEAEAGLLERHLEAHRDRPRRAAIGRIVQQDLDPTRPFHAFLLRDEEWRRRRLRGVETIGFGEVWTGQFSVERDEALAAGGFDERIRGYGLEDIEFAYRLGRRGVRFVYLDEAVTRHRAFADTFDRWCARQRSVGEVAAYLARRHDTPEMRRYLRIEREARPRPTAFLRLMDASAALLRRPAAAAFFAGPIARPLLRGGVRALEALRLRRPLAFAYTFLRDVQYFDALGREMRA